MSDLERFISAVQLLKRGTQRGRKKPHKLLMVLAVIDLAAVGQLGNNRIVYDDPLIERFRKQFEVYGSSEDWLQPAPPFFHLRSSDFWQHAIIPGKEREYASLTTSGGGSKRIRDTIEYAYLSDYAYRVMMQQDERDQLRTAVIAALNED